MTPFMWWDNRLRHKIWKSEQHLVAGQPRSQEVKPMRSMEAGRTSVILTPHLCPHAGDWARLEFPAPLPEAER